MNFWFVIVIPAISGLIAGIAGYLITPWIPWWIEKRKLKLLAKIALIKKVRLNLSDPPDKKAFSQSVVYSQIKPYLKKEVQEFIENEAIVVVTGNGRNSGANNYKNRVLDDLSRLENEWKLIE